jgi:hypothetical protein
MNHGKTKQLLGSLLRCRGLLAIGLVGSQARDNRHFAAASGVARGALRYA